MNTQNKSILTITTALLLITTAATIFAITFQHEQTNFQLAINADPTIAIQIYAAMIAIDAALVCAGIGLLAISYTIIKKLKQ